MKITVNGEVKELDKEVNILELLELENVEMPDMVSVELNGEILDREDFATTIVKENDVFEFLYFMGGGSVGL